MKKYLVFILTFIITPLLSIAQLTNQGRIDTDTLPPNYQMEVTALREHIYLQIPNELNNKINPRTSFRFADESSIQTSLLLTSGQVYSDWEELEHYVNKILQKVLPNELKKDTLVHAYIIKRGTHNAFMTPSGMMFLNIGLFDGIESEAALASIIAHEVAHHFLKHSLHTYVKEKKGEFKSGLFLINKNGHSHHSVQVELEADSLSMLWLRNAGYNLEGVKQSLKILERIEANLLLRSKRIWELKETTHPKSEKRIKLIQSFIEKSQQDESTFYLVSEEKFKRFKKESKVEILKHLIYNFEYAKCLETAFKYHVLEPLNGTYIYYLMESIRRNAYLNSDIWSDNFLTYRYFKVIETKYDRSKEAMNTHAFAEIPKEILSLNDQEVKICKKSFYWNGEPKFKTNEEAYLFFYKLGLKLKQSECLFSNALSLHKDTILRNKLLNLYLKQEDIQHREFAENLLYGKIHSSLPNKTLSIFSDFYVTIREGKDEVFIRSQNGEENLKDILKESIKSFDNRKFLYLSDLKNTQLNDYVLLKQLEILSMISIRTKGNQTQIHILNPEYWEILKKFQVNEFEFINISYYDVRKANYTLDSYKALINTSYQYLLTEEKRNRYIQAIMTSIREVEGGRMKIRFYGQEKKLNYKKESVEQIIDYIRNNLEFTDEEKGEQDERSRNTIQLKK